MHKYFSFFYLLLISALFSCKTSNDKDYIVVKQSNSVNDSLTKEGLTSFENYVIREKGTERAFTGKYWNFFEEGIYVCKACNQKLFESNSKFDSNCGWPSFDKAIKGSVTYTKDTSLGMDRVEVTCAKCKAHLGHVFDDGPEETTGQRYCTNSVSIKFIPKNEISN
jgi:peptide-methionine (R)-S-oxide reductase